MATSVALKCCISEEILDDLEKSINKLDLETDNYLSKMQEKSCEVPQQQQVTNTLNGAISFGVPRMVKGPKTRRSKDPVEQKKRKRSAKNKGEDPNSTTEIRDEIRDDVYEQQSSTMVASDVYGQSSTMNAPLIQAGIQVFYLEFTKISYWDLLLNSYISMNSWCNL
ncbi:uncharacterized protein LOC107305293 [Oryza brachyantha]|uniref:uncharacterized protein LOC107305293 n=1 Tax=Oryza brachyantha TaxID=4533 RepID=UPI0007763A4D|nr:uncharacterized protein LOC107305293 [Oryza brachyantha]